MIFTNPLVLAAMAAALCHAGPVMPVAPRPINVARGDELAIRDAIGKTIRDTTANPLEKRTFASCDLSNSWSGKTFFDGSYNNDAGKKVDMSVKCKTCYTKGSVKASMKDTSLIKPTMRLDFSSVEAYVDLALSVSESSVYSVNLFTTQAPLGIGYDSFSVGVVFAVDLVFTLSEQIEIDGGGFYVQVGAGAFIETSLLTGEIVSSSMDGTGAKSLPITVKGGAKNGCTMKADLRVRTQCGAEGSIAGIGAGLEVGVFANLIEFVTVLDSTETCEMESKEHWGCNVGAFAHSDVSINYHTWGAVPTVSTKLVSAPVATQCYTRGHGGSSETRSTTSTTSSSETTSKSKSTSESTSESTTSSSDSTSASISITSSKSTNSSATTYSSASTSSSASLASSTSYSAATSTVTTTSSEGVSATTSVVTTNVVETSTVLSTSTFTITSCAASVVNCPASYQKSITVTKTVTVGGGTTTDVVTTTAVAIATVTAVTDVTVLVPCSTPIVQTFTITAMATTYTSEAAATSTQTLTTATTFKNGTLSGTYTPTRPATKTGTTTSGAIVVATAGAAVLKLGNGLAAAAGLIAAAVLL